MIRAFEQHDMERILDIWLSASLKAHDFIEAAHWQSHVETLRNIYIPASESYVIEEQSRVLGFCSLLDNQLAALFIDPAFQGKGLGKQLLKHAKALRNQLTLTVYKENTPGCAFYLSQGCVVVQEQIDAQTGQTEYLMATANAIARA
ncbi:putative N-acetyltransferase YjaB [Pseudomonas fluorescens]|uniref:Putative N-acetyltransferase YjaB n=1 Tax=Pseudomonas fluorescens TaxID=294 RepID=A0A5E7IJV3_PSEFL|nr:N-acetyltransferase [Pseudomonas fluorescens]VVO76675.1 putative N-acetyltransferase YjaB [Pseudomonas fluorescens]